MRHPTAMHIALAVLAICILWPAGPADPQSPAYPAGQPPQGSYGGVPGSTGPGGYPGGASGAQEAIYTHGVVDGVVGWLRASGTRIQDDTHSALFLHGVNSTGMEWGEGAAWGTPGATMGGWVAPTPEEYDNVEKWGFNIVRVPISWANIEPVKPAIGKDGKLIYTYNQAYLQALDRIVQEFGKRHVAVILSMYQWGWSPAFPARGQNGAMLRGNGMPSWSCAGRGSAAARVAFFQNKGQVQDSYVAAWEAVIRRYRDNRTVVGVDLFNEPTTQAVPSGPQPPTIPLDGFYTRLGRSIRAIDPDVLLILQDSLYTPLNARPPFSGVVYSFHNEPDNWKPDGLKRASAYEKRAAAWHVPLLLTEFTTIGDTSRPSGAGGWETETGQEGLYCDQHEIGWIYWAYQGGSPAPLGGPAGTGPVNEGVVRFLQSGFIGAPVYPLPLTTAAAPKNKKPHRSSGYRAPRLPRIYRLPKPRGFKRWKTVY